MIQPKDLRIGNFVKDRGGKVLRIDFFEHLEDDHSCKFGQHNPMSDDWGPLHPFTEYTNDAEPIPLTPEILLKLGFEKDGHDGAVWYQKDFPVIGELCTSDRGHPLGNFLFDTNTDTLKINYLHQLQNLYYSLMGSELEVVW